MAHDVFLSHSSKDKAVADSVTYALEHAGIRCWVAPRDILPGSSWGASIIDAIEESSIMVIIFSANSNQSAQVMREVERAVRQNVVVLPFRIDHIEPSGDLAYFLGATHWLDAIDSDLESSIKELVATTRAVLEKTGAGESFQSTRPAIDRPAAPIDIVAPLPEEPAPPNKRRVWLSLLGLLILGINVSVIYQFYQPKNQISSGNLTADETLTQTGNSSPHTSETPSYPAATAIRKPSDTLSDEPSGKQAEVAIDQGSLSKDSVTGSDDSIVTTPTEEVASGGNQTPASDNQRASLTARGGLADKKPEALIDRQGSSPTVEASPATSEVKTIDPVALLESSMVEIPAGSFRIGSPRSESGRSRDEQQTRVTVRSFQLGKYEVTQALWQAVMGANPAHFSACQQCPVENVSWLDTQQFLKRLNELTANNYRLPSEAEWEWAARADSSTAFFQGACISSDDANFYGKSSYANCGVSGSRYLKETRIVGSYPANRWGLHDMQGNVFEWTCSPYTKRYDGTELTCVNTVGTDQQMSLRGGSWFSFGKVLRAANRSSAQAGEKNKETGFRLARTR